MVKIGFIMYTIVETHINITFAILIVSYFTKNLRPNYFSIINQILKYLASSQDKKIISDNVSEL